jgi:hypothetical protein
MSDIIVDTLRIDGGIILVINPPLAYDEKVVLRFINKISKEDKSSFLFPALYGKSLCKEGEIVSDEVYDLYDDFKREVSYENIFVFEALNAQVSTYAGENTQSINALVEYVKEVIKAQNDIKSTSLTDEFEDLMKSQFYNDFLEEFGFTASEILILKGLFKYAFLTGISVTELIQEIKGNIEGNASKKLLRKEFINVLRQRLS